jgi:hypothetical protein
MMAYVFWHYRRPDITRSDYESALVAFHEALAAASPQGLLRTTVFRRPSAPWFEEQGEVLEDWHFLENSAGLDVLNEAAVSGDRLQPHNRVAAMAAAGTAGLYSLRRGRLATVPPAAAHWFAKPDGMSYQAFFESLRPHYGNGASLWGRQMVLGPTPEFCLLAASPAQLPCPAFASHVETVFDREISLS